MIGPPVSLAGSTYHLLHVYTLIVAADITAVNIPGIRYLTIYSTAVGILSRRLLGSPHGIVAGSRGLARIVRGY